MYIYSIYKRNTQSQWQWRTNTFLISVYSLVVVGVK